MAKTCWKDLISKEMEEEKESWRDVVRCTLSEEDLLAEFDNGYLESKGKPFTLWTKERVYFPAIYNEAEWVASVPRNPCDEAKAHVGGE
jgi:hypothetical protein